MNHILLVLAWVCGCLSFQALFMFPAAYLMRHRSWPDWKGQLLLDIAGLPAFGVMCFVGIMARDHDMIVVGSFGTLLLTWHVGHGWYRKVIDSSPRKATTHDR